MERWYVDNFGGVCAACPGLPTRKSCLAFHWGTMLYMAAYVKEVVWLLGGDKNQLPMMFVIFFAAAAVDLVGLSLMLPYVSYVVGEADGNDFGGGVFAVLPAGLRGEHVWVMVSVSIIMVYMFKSFLSVWMHHTILKFCQRQQVRLQAALIWAYMKMSYVNVVMRNSAEFSYAVQGLVVIYVNNVLLSMMRMVSESVIGVVIVVYLAWVDIYALLLLISLNALFVVGYDRLFRERLLRYGRQSNIAAKKIVRGVNEGIDGVKEIRVLGKEEYFCSLVIQGAEDYAANAVRMNVVNAVPRYLLEFVVVVFVVVFVAIGVYENGDARSTGAVLALFGVAAMRLVPIVSTLANGLQQLRSHRDAVSRLYQDMQQADWREIGISKTKDCRHVDRFESLIIKGVSFRYPSATQEALREVSLAIGSGDSVGLIGRSGSGKTTFVDMMLGLLFPQSGELLYNGRDLASRLNEWRCRVAYLPQQVFLIDASIRRNIALGVEESEIDNVRLEQAIEQSRLGDVVRLLPQGVETLVGERGVRLSGGQRQRIALARAFYHGRDVLVLDEATSALDNESESEIIDEIRRLKGKKT